MVLFYQEEGVVLERWGAPVQEGTGEGPLPSELRMSAWDITQEEGREPPRGHQADYQLRKLPSVLSNPLT